MDKKSKLISGLTKQKIVKKPSRYFTDAEKHIIIQEMLESGCTKRDIWEKYTGQKEEHGQILRWMRKLGYDDSIPNRRPNFAPNPIQMKKKNSTEEPSTAFEYLQLKKRIEELEKQYPPNLLKAYLYGEFVNLTSGTVYSLY